MTRWNSTVIASAFLVSVLCLPGTEAGGETWDPLLPDVRIWRGEVRISRTGSAHEKWDKSHRGKTNTYFMNRTVTDTLVIKACGQSGALYVLEAKRSLSDITESENYWQNTRELCDVPGSRRPKRISPGDSRRISIRTAVTPYTGEGTGAERDRSWVALEILPLKNYALSAGNNGVAGRDEDNIESYRRVCADKTTRMEAHIRTGAPGEPPRVESSGSEEGEGTVVQWLTAPPTDIPLATNSRGSVQGNTILEIDHLVGEIKSGRDGGYEEVTKASWEFTARNPCPEVFNEFLLLVAIGEAYADRPLREFAEDLEDYERKVNWKVYENRYGTPPPKDFGKDGEGNVGFSMWVHDNCQLGGRVRYEKEQLEECSVLVIAKAAVRHEMEHVSQCKGNLKKFRSRTIEARGQSEVSAYSLESGILLNWLTDYCKDVGLDLAGARGRLQRLKAKKAGWK